MHATSTWLKRVDPPDRVRCYVERLTRLAVEDAGVEMPTIIYYSGWTPDAEFFCELPIEALGYAQPGRNTIALDAHLQPEHFAHVIAHEVKHLAGERDEAACCAFARAFTARRFHDILAALNEANFEYRPASYFDRQCGCGG